jgi:hypothetical protein
MTTIGSPAASTTETEAVHQMPTATARIATVSLTLLFVFIVVSVRR